MNYKTVCKAMMSKVAGGEMKELYDPYKTWVRNYKSIIKNEAIPALQKAYSHMDDAAIQSVPLGKRLTELGKFLADRPTEADLRRSSSSYRQYADSFPSAYADRKLEFQKNLQNPYYKDWMSFWNSPDYAIKDTAGEYGGNAWRDE